MKMKHHGVVMILLAAAIILSGLTAAQVSESTTIYASLPAKIEVSIPSQYKELQMSSCEPGKSASIPGGIEVKSNINWGLTVSGSTSSGHMIGSSGSPANELHNPMTISSQTPAGGPLSLPGTGSNPTTAALLSNMGLGDYSGASIIGLTFDQVFEWSDPADNGYQITVTLTATPA